MANLASGRTNARALADRFFENLKKSPAAFIAADRQQVFAEAQASDQRRRTGTMKSPFDGLLFAVKDNIDVAGYRTTNGSKFRLSDPPRNIDAEIVAAIRRAGMIVCGKTNLSELAFSGLGLNPHFGTPSLTRFHPRRAPGGSSAGSAVAVADGLVPLALGTDTAGSLRIPAAFCDLVGFRASSGRYSMDGVEPLAGSFDTLGALATSVSDLISFDTLATSLISGGNRDVSNVEFVVDPHFLDTCGASAEVRAGFDQAVSRLVACGASVRYSSIPQLSVTLELIQSAGWPGGFEASKRFAPLLSSPDRGSVDERIVSRLEDSRMMTASTYNTMMIRRVHLMAEFSRTVGDAVVLMPTVSMVPPILKPLIDDPAVFARANLEALRLTMIGSFLDAGVVAMPLVPTADDLPVSLSLLGPRGNDEMVLHAALQVEQSLWLQNAGER